MLLKTLTLCSVLILTLQHFTSLFISVLYESRPSESLQWPKRERWLSFRYPKWFFAPHYCDLHVLAARLDNLHQSPESQLHGATFRSDLLLGVMFFQKLTHDLGTATDRIRLQTQRCKQMYSHPSAWVTDTSWNSDKQIRFWLNLFAAAEPYTSAKVTHGTPCFDTRVQRRMRR